MKLLKHLLFASVLISLLSAFFLVDSNVYGASSMVYTNPTVNEYSKLENLSTNGVIRTLVQVENTIYFGGTFTEVRIGENSPIARENIAAYDITTKQLTTWNPGANNTVEIIVVDDGSTDDSVQKAQSYPSDKVKVVSQRNSGACSARNKAFALSSGDYIQFIDADDIISPNKIESQIILLNNSTDSIASGKWTKFNESIDNVHLEELKIYRDYNNPIDLLVEMWNSRLMMANHSWLLPRKVVIDAGPWNEALSINQDGEFFCRVLMVSKSVLYSDLGVSYYRTGVEGSVSKSKGNRKKAESLLMSFMLYKQHLSTFLDRYEIREALAINFYSFIYMYYHEYSDLVKVAISETQALMIQPPLGKIGGGGFEKIAPYLGFYNVLRLRKLKKRIVGSKK